MLNNILQLVGGLSLHLYFHDFGAALRWCQGCGDVHIIGSRAEISGRRFVRYNGRLIRHFFRSNRNRHAQA